MTEKEKMLAGELYDASYNEELKADLHKAKDMCAEYNRINPSEVDKKMEYIKKIFGSTKNNVWIGGNVAVMPGVTIGDNVTIGAGSVVTKNIPANSVAFGNPCKVYKNL